MADLPAGFRMRRAGPGDHAALLEICLKTGDSGGDGTALHDDPDLLGLVYAVPYQVRCPDFAYVVEDAAGVCGYALGAPDSLDFQRWIDGVWYPPLRASLSNPGDDPGGWRGSDWVRWQIHAPQLPPPVDLERYPAHGHIDLLPRAQGRGLGAVLLGRVMVVLQQAGCAGMHLGVSPRNLRAQGFYAKLGFQMLGEAGDTVYMGYHWGPV